ncbi:MAG TPA: Gfo/Idh/MocA family oxidoreductase, partial [Oscillospiraceae bacterium]|nr:Gfo/Idh/MocA family oxidoreductase [Oscillospiraceae bacterium]
KNTAKKLGQYSKYKNIHGANLQHFVNVIENKEKPDFTIDQGVNMIKILNAIYESAETGKEVIL